MGKFLRHTSCGECQSSDANALYDEGKNVISSHCFSCGFSKANVDKKPREWGHKEEEEIVVEQPVYLTDDMIEKLPSAGVRERGIVKNLSSYYG